MRGGKGSEWGWGGEGGPKLWKFPFLSNSSVQFEHVEEKELSCKVLLNDEILISSKKCLSSF